MPRTRSIAWSELKLGLAGLVAIALSTVLILAVGGQGGFFWQRYPLLVRFDDVQGLKSGAVVRLNGMEVGKVTDVAFAGAEVEVRMEISRSVRELITTESEAAMGSLSLLGEPIVDIRAAPGGSPLPDGAHLRAGRGSGVAELANTATRSLDEVTRMLDDARAGRGSLGRLLSDDALYEEMRTLVAAAGRVAERLERGEGTLGALATDPAAYRTLRATLENLEAVSAALLAGEGTAGRLLTDSGLHDRVSALAGRMEGILAELEAGEGTAGLLLQDRALYESVSESAAEARSLIAELRALVADVRADPRRYLSVRFSLF
jgi:phospholipid/cholesterol/gamma-HCH transport system substrate-binding protein